MKVNLKKIAGNWSSGYALDKHVLSSEFLGHNEWGHPMFDTTRSEVGEAAYQLKYTLLIDQMTIVAKMPSHLPNAKERCLKELFINLAHEREVHRRLALGPVVE